MYKSPTGGEYPQFLESLTNIVKKHINPACAADEINEKYIQPIIKERDELAQIIQKRIGKVGK